MLISFAGGRKRLHKRMEEAKCCDWVILWPCLLQIKKKKERKKKICFSLNIEHKLAGAYYGGKECIVINYCNHPLEMYLQVFFCRWNGRSYFIFFKIFLQEEIIPSNQGVKWWKKCLVKFFTSWCIYVFTHQHTQSFFF